MKIGVPTEIKTSESRVGLTPAAVASLVKTGHSVLIESNAGAAIGYTDQHYADAGAEIYHDAASVFLSADMIVKVKEPQASEIAMLRPDQCLFTYLHLAADREMTEALMRSGCTAIAYETVQDESGRLPLLAPMSQVAGRMASLVAAESLMLHRGGMGKLMGGVPGVAPAKVLILGAGVVGTEAAKMAVGLGADLTVVDRSLSRLGQIDELFSGRVKTQASIESAVDQLILEADVVIGAVLIPGARAPKLVRLDHLKAMRAGSVLVDVAIDQGGCFETSHPTTHKDPTFVVDGVLHYCVANMPGAVARTSTEALVAATLPYVHRLAAGVGRALSEDRSLARGLSIERGELVCPQIRQAYGL